MYIVFLLQFSKNFMSHYWVTKMGADFASLCQKMFITAIILRKIMFQQVQAVCETWHMCELAISHRSYNIVSNNKTKGKTLGRGISYTLIWSWSLDMWSLSDPEMQSLFCKLLTKDWGGSFILKVPTSEGGSSLMKSMSRVSHPWKLLYDSVSVLVLLILKCIFSCNIKALVKGKQNPPKEVFQIAVYY